MGAVALATFPTPRASDGEEVQCALEVARACWMRGDLADAVRWLRRASQAAAQADHLTRAMELSKFVAKASQQLERERRERESTVVPAGTAAAEERRLDVPPPPPLPRMLTRDDDDHQPPSTPAPPRAHATLFEDDDEDDVPTQVRRVMTPQVLDGPDIVDVHAGRVAVRRAGTRLEVLPLRAGEPAPEGAAVVMMVAPSLHDARLLAGLLGRR